MDELNGVQTSLREGSTHDDTSLRESLTHAEVARYSRQMILTEIGMSGQLSLASAKVLVVGCGGLGCPSSMYLAAAGVGTIGLLDYDEVEMSNLHRQTLHTEARVGVAKADSIKFSLSQLNSCVKLIAHKSVLDSSNAMEVIKDYDVILDCTDNVATRYLLNDACVLSKKPLVSGAALRWEGQVTVYNYNEGPCYRCLFPSPPDPSTVTNCSDGGVIGAVPGIIGSFQALEAIKIITNSGNVLSQAMLVFDGLRQTNLKAKLRGRQASCVVCGDQPSLTQLIDYVEFCGAAAADKDSSIDVLRPQQRITVTDYKHMLAGGSSPHVLLDVRQPVELSICALPEALNIPLKELKKSQRIEEIKEAMTVKGTKEVLCVCRRGNDSQLAVAALGTALGDDAIVRDIIGGLTQWARVVDSSMPVY